MEKLYHANPQSMRYFKNQPIKYLVLAVLLISAQVFSSQYIWAADRTISQADKNKAVEVFTEGMQFFSRGKNKKALELWHKSLEIDPTRASTAMNMGIAYKRLGDYNTGIEYYQKAITLNPQYGRAYYNMGLAYYYLEDYEQAQKIFLKALELNYHNADVYFSLAQTYYTFDNCDKAIDAYKNAVRYDPSYPRANYYLAECYSRSHKLSSDYLAGQAYKKESEMKDSRFMEKSLEEYTKINKRFSKISLTIVLFCAIGIGFPLLLFEISTRGFLSKNVLHKDRSSVTALFAFLMLLLTWFANTDYFPIQAIGRILIAPGIAFGVLISDNAYAPNKTAVIIVTALQWTFISYLLSLLVFRPSSK